MIIALILLAIAVIVVVLAVDHAHQRDAINDQLERDRRNHPAATTFGPDWCARAGHPIEHQDDHGGFLCYCGQRGNITNPSIYDQETDTP